MPNLDFAAASVSLDDDGFLIDPTCWNEGVAQTLARNEGLPTLSGEHWRVIAYLRQFYAQNGAAPPIRVLCRETGFTLKEIYDLFPSGPARGACKIAGLPKPSGCI